MPLRHRIEQTLTRLATVHGANDYFAVGRVQVAGEPTGWREEITFERRELQTYSRNRSGVDEGGAAIGVWKARAEDYRAQALADALAGARVWNFESDRDLQPGMELVNWSIVTGEGIFDLIIKTSSPHMKALMPADVELRNIANTLEEQRTGAQMRTALRTQVTGRSVSLALGFANEGTQPCILVNPFASTAAGGNYFRVEIAAMPDAAPNETGQSAVFKPVQFELFAQGDLTEPWGDEYLLLAPGARLVLPGAPMLTLQPGAHIVRAVYSNYGLLRDIAGVPVILGRSFSNEVVVKL